MNCGSPLEGEQPAAREERKVVTVFFADLVGFTGRAEQLDPEDVRAMLSPYYVRLRSEIERFGGTVEKFIGDAVMAVFGAPVTPFCRVSHSCSVKSAFVAMRPPVSKSRSWERTL